jgi:hypothetical protein
MQGQDRSQSDFHAAKTELADKFEEGKRTAREALHDAKDEVTRKAGEYVSEAKATLFEQAEGTQSDISSNMKAFGGALRAASEHLANSDQRAASKFVLDAAGGLERLSSSLKDKPFEEILGEIRAFGRDNSGALIAGSILAGIALGRFIKSSAVPSRTDGSSSQSTSDDPDAGPSTQGGESSSLGNDLDDGWPDTSGEPGR